MIKCYFCQNICDLICEKETLLKHLKKVVYTQYVTIYVYLCMCVCVYIYTTIYGNCITLLIHLKKVLYTQYVTIYVYLCMCIYVCVCVYIFIQLFMVTVCIQNCFKVV